MGRYADSAEEAKAMFKDGEMAEIAGLVAEGLDSGKAEISDRLDVAEYGVFGLACRIGPVAFYIGDNALSKKEYLEGRTPAEVVADVARSIEEMFLNDRSEAEECLAVLKDGADAPRP